MGKVLLIMEPDRLRDALVEQLQKDWEITACFDAREGAALLRQAPDILILDLFLPGTNGILFLRENRRYIPPAVIALSTFLSGAVLETLEDLGVTAVVRKPCTVDCILSHCKLPV